MGIQWRSGGKEVIWENLLQRNCAQAEGEGGGKASEKGVATIKTKRNKKHGWIETGSTETGAKTTKKSIDDLFKDSMRFFARKLKSNDEVLAANPLIIVWLRLAATD